MHEALTYSAFLRLPEAVSRQVKEEFVDEIMNVVELGALRNAIVGLPGAPAWEVLSGRQAFGQRITA